MLHSKIKKAVIWAIGTVLMLSVGFDICTQKNRVVASNQKEQYSLVGSWVGAGYRIGTDCYTAYLSMTINEDGEFSVTDHEAGNPGIKGVLDVLDETTLDFDCEADEDFDSPWPGLKKRDQVEYHFYNNDQIRLSHGETSIVFYREGKRFKLEPYFKGNWKRDLNKPWYTNDGVDSSETYYLRYDLGTFMIYQKTKSEEILVGSFCGLNFNTKTKVLKTITELKDASNLPKNWRGMTEGRHFQKFTLNYDSANHCLKVTHNGKSINFYSNITYGIKKGSLQECLSQYYSWQCKTAKAVYTISFDHQEDGDSITVGRKKSKKRTEFAYVELKSVNASKRTASLKWKDYSDESLYENVKLYKTASYRIINSKKIEIKFGGKKYIFTPAP